MKAKKLPRYLDISESGQFSGTFDELKEAISGYGFGWKWKRQGLVYVLKRARESSTDFWWSDTSDYLTVYDMIDDEPFPRTSRLDWRPKRALEKKQGKLHGWSRFDFNGMKGVSLPELFFRDYRSFIKDLVYGSSPLRGPTEAELAEVMDKASGIRVPETAPSGSVVSMKFLPNGAFVGIDVGPLSSVPPRGRGRLKLTREINMLTVFDDVANVDAYQSIAWLTAILDDGQSHAWPRERCEAFFNESRNFWPRSMPYDKSEEEEFRQLPSGC